MWKQTLQDVTVSIPVPAGSKSRDLVVEIRKKHLKVALKGQPAILEGELAKEIKVDDSTWTLGELHPYSGERFAGVELMPSVRRQTTRARSRSTSRSPTSRPGGQMWSPRHPRLTRPRSTRRTRS